MIDYIGDISKNDALVLKELAEHATNILEFGPGASTQVMAAYTSGRILSVETEPSWIESAKGHLERLGLSADFVSYDQFSKSPGGPYDLVFNDGALSLREEFALAAWDCLKADGVLCFHDTRTTRVVLQIASFFSTRSASIKRVEVNKDLSNITVIHKRPPLHYENWNVAESRTEYEAGR